MQNLSASTRLTLWVRYFSVVRAGLCIMECLASPCRPTKCQKHFASAVVTTKNVPRLCQMSPGDKVVPYSEPLVYCSGCKCSKILYYCCYYYYLLEVLNFAMCIYYFYNKKNYLLIEIKSIREGIISLHPGKTDKVKYNGLECHMPWYI